MNVSAWSIRNPVTPIVLFCVLALLGTVGVFALFAMAAGILQPASRSQANPLLKAVVDNAFDGIVVTGANEQCDDGNIADGDTPRIEGLRVCRLEPPDKLRQVTLDCLGGVAAAIAACKVLVEHGLHCGHFRSPPNIIWPILDALWAEIGHKLDRFSL